MKNKKALIIIALAVIIIATVIVYIGIQKDSQESTLNEQSTDLEKQPDNSEDIEPLEEEKIEQITVITDIQKSVESIDSYIPNTSKEELQQILEEEVKEEQKETISEVLGENKVELNYLGEIDAPYVYEDMASLQAILNSKLQIAFAEFATDAQYGKYEYEKIVPILYAYAKDLQAGIIESNQFNETEITSITASMLSEIDTFKMKLEAYIGSSRLRTDEELAELGIENSEDRPYQEIINLTIEEAQEKQKEIQQEIIEKTNGTVVIPD